MNRRTLIMLIILGLMLPFSAYRIYSTFFKGRGASRTRTISAPQTTAYAPPPATREETQGEVAGAEARPFQAIPVKAASFNQLVASGRWGRNPFLTADEIRNLSKRPEKRATVIAGIPRAQPDLRVTSILISGDEGIAVINGEFYTVGDVIPATGDRIVAIMPDQVLVEVGGIQKQIPLRQSRIPLKSRER